MSNRIITYVTGNVKKLEEVVMILGNDFPFKLTNVNIDLPEYQGEPEYIVREKCKLAAQYVQGPVITEDSSLCFNALKGLPGPYIKCFLSKLGNQGLCDMLNSYSDKSAVALCLFAYTPGHGEPVMIFEGKINGFIVSPRGSGDFGWDRIFVPDGYDRAYAEMSKDYKNTISHRSLALKNLKNYFLSNILMDVKL